MGKWEMVRLGDVLEYEQPTKYIVQSTNYSNDYSIPVLTAGQSFILGYTDEDVNIFSENLPVIIFDDFTTAIKYVDFPFKVKSSAMKILKPQRDVDIKYLYYYMTRIKVDTELHKRYWISMYSNIQVPRPPLPIQQKIAYILDRASALIEKRKAQIVKLDLLVKSQFVEMFGDPVTNPMGWEVCEINKICSVIVDCPHSTPNYLQENTGYMCIRTSILKPNKIDWDSIEYISQEQYIERTKRYIPRKDDIVYSREGAILGIAAMIENDYKVALGQRMMLLSVELELCHPIFVCFMLNSNRIMRIIKSKISGSASPHINVADVKMFEIPLPPITLQTKFATFVERIEAQKEQMKQSLALMELEYKALMQKCFSGEMF